MSYFEDLKVWQRSVDLAVKVYELSRNDPFNRDFGLRDQMRKSSVSISSNIAERDQLGSDKAAIRHFNIAKGSALVYFPDSISERTFSLKLSLYFLIVLLSFNIFN